MNGCEKEWGERDRERGKGAGERYEVRSVMCYREPR